MKEQLFMRTSLTQCDALRHYTFLFLLEARPEPFYAQHERRRYLSLIKDLLWPLTAFRKLCS